MSQHIQSSSATLRVDTEGGGGSSERKCGSERATRAAARVMRRDERLVGCLSYQEQKRTGCYEKVIDILRASVCFTKFNRVTTFSKFVWAPTHTHTNPKCR